MRSEQETAAKMIGKQVSAVSVASGDSDAKIFFMDGAKALLHLEGDCCSGSYFNDAAQFQELIGRRITNVEFRDEKSRTPVEKDEHNGETSWHFLVITTDAGHVTIDWRNESNGYYDGWVEVSIE